MSFSPKNILVCGGSGFIGSNFIRYIYNKYPDYKIFNLDLLTYAGNPENLSDIEQKESVIDSAEKRYNFIHGDICDGALLNNIFVQNNFDVVINFAAESHVDRSIGDASPFIATNIKGTQVIIDASRKYGVKKFIFISTDEVYGEIAKGKFNGLSLGRPNSPYAASKAAADLLVQAYFRTHKLPAIIVRPSNNYGPWQYPEKLIPVIIYKALKNEKVPLYARGLNVREWLYVDDCAGGILKAMERGKAGEIYNIGSGSEHKNIEVAKVILDILGRPHSLIKFVQDRPGHDIRYSLDSAKIRRELNWRPAVNFDAGIEKTVNWYVDNLRWLKTKVKYLRSYWKNIYKG